MATAPHQDSGLGHRLVAVPDAVAVPRPCARNSWRTRLRCIGAPSQMMTIRRDTSRRRCSRKATTSSESIAWSWQGTVPRAFGRDGADGREMVTPPPLPHDGRVARQGPRCARPWATDSSRIRLCRDRVLRGLRPRLRAGQVSSRQRAMAASSRWRARRAGVCGLQPITWSRRPPWTGWRRRQTPAE